MADPEIKVAALTLERAASDYFDANAKRLDHQKRVAVTRFISWAGGERDIRDLTAHQMTLYQDAQGSNVADLSQRLLPVKAFFAYAKKRSWLDNNLGIHLRVKKAQRAAEAVQAGAEEAVEMTAEGLQLAKTELERLRAERPRIAKQLEEAMADKDFRENAPLDAARDQQAHVEARIRDLEHDIAHAVVSSRRGTADGGAHLGSTLTVTNLVSNRTVQYTLVGQNEVDAGAGRISNASPVGRALIGSQAGDNVQVVTPSGTIGFRVDEVEH